MVKRVRPAAAPGDNVTDAVLVQALGACAATYSAQEEAAEAAKTARSAHSNELKRWKKMGIAFEPLKRAVKERFLDPREVLANVHAYVRMRALQNMPSIQQDLLALWTDIDLPDETKAQIERDRWRDEGSFSAREKAARDANPHQPGSEAYQCWDQGWLHDQNRIATAMGAGAAPVDISRAKPVRKQASRKKQAAAAPQLPVNGGRRRRTLTAVH